MYQGKDFGVGTLKYISVINNYMLVCKKSKMLRCWWLTAKMLCNIFEPFGKDKLLVAPLNVCLFNKKKLPCKFFAGQFFFCAPFGNGNGCIFQFKRYEDASLEYTGVNRHADDLRVGGFNTVVTKEEFVNM